jgi:membrane protein required for colicin V production
MTHFSAYDWIVLLVLLLSMAVGLLRGVIRELASIVSWAGAFVAARQLAEPLAGHFERSIENGALRLSLAFIVVFVVTLIVIGLLGQWIAQAARKVGLRPLDRVLGAGFGLVRGALILIVLVLLAAAVGVNEQRDWKQAASTVWLERLAAYALPVLPPALAGRIHLHRSAAGAAAVQHGEG